MSLLDSLDCLMSSACCIRNLVISLSSPCAITIYVMASSSVTIASWASASLALATCSLCSSSAYFVKEDELLLSSVYV
eukprot:Em0006g986a